MANKAAKEKDFIVSDDTKHTDEFQKMADEAMRELDRSIRWKKIHALLRRTNKKARKEQDVTAKDCAFFREEGLIKSTKTGKMGLRWGVSIPPMTWNALIQADELATGNSELSNPDKEGSTDLKGSNQIVKDLEKAFPQYKVSR